MKVFGHPIHLLLIHFPSALFPMDLACAGIVSFNHNPVFYHASKIALIAGTLLGWLAVTAGAFDLLTVMKNKPGSMKKALVHGGINSAVLTGYTFLSFLAYKAPETLTETSPGTFILKTFLVLSMIIGNFIGGSLVLKDKVLDEK